MNTRKLLQLTATVAALALPLSAFASIFPAADTFGHVGTNNPATCAAIATSGATGLSGDDNCVVRNIGFTFTFYGVNYTTVGIGTNGQLTLGGCTTGSTNYTNTCIPTAATPNAAVFAHWDDMDMSAAGTVTDGLSGTGTNQIYTVDWSNIPYFAGGAPASFQVQLHQNGGAGEFVRTRLTATNGSTSYTRGIENALGADGMQSECNQAPPALPSCHQYSMPAPTGTPCDLAPVMAALAVIEGKLDTNATRMTNLTNIVNNMSTNVDNLTTTVNNMNATLNALAAAVASHSGALCDIVRLLNTPQGQGVACDTSIVSLCGTTYSWGSESTGGSRPNPPECP